VKLSAALLISAGLLLAAQACFAEDKWAGSLGARARTELNRLGVKGRTAFKIL